MNKILSLSAEERERGIVAASAGNHALGVAHAAQCLGLTKADLFVQANAAPAKIAKLRQYNVNLHLVGHLFDEAQAAAFEFAEKTGATYVSAYDDLDVIAGQGTVGLEIMQDLPDVDTIVVPVGGGGLIAGLATVAKSLNPTIRVIGVNPAASPSAYLSKRDGYSLRNVRERTDAGARFGRRLRARAVHGRHDADRRDRAGQRRGNEARHRGVDRFRSDSCWKPRASRAWRRCWRARSPDARKCVCVLTGGNIDTATLKTVLNSTLWLDVVRGA